MGIYEYIKNLIGSTEKEVEFSPDNIRLSRFMEKRYGGRLDDIVRIENALFEFPLDSLGVAKDLNNHAYFLTAVDDSDVVYGYMSGDLDRIHNLAVRPDVQRLGIGTKLVDYAKKQGQDVSTVVRGTNKGAIEFFEENGFRNQGSIGKIYDQLPREEAILLVYESPKVTLPEKVLDFDLSGSYSPVGLLSL